MLIVPHAYAKTLKSLQTASGKEGKFFSLPVGEAEEEDAFEFHAPIDVNTIPISSSWNQGGKGESHVKARPC